VELVGEIVIGAFNGLIYYDRRPCVSMICSYCRLQFTGFKKTCRDDELLSSDETVDTGHESSFSVMPATGSPFHSTPTSSVPLSQDAPSRVNADEYEYSWWLIVALMVSIFTLVIVFTACILLIRHRSSSESKYSLSRYLQVQV